MSRTEGRDQRRGSGAESREAAGEACRADDIRALLGRIADQITDADHRHTRALADMQGRLAELGREAESVRRLVPAEFAPAFERIEDGMALLAERIAAAERERREARVVASAADAPTAPAAPVDPPAPAPLAAAVFFSTPMPAPMAAAPLARPPSFEDEVAAATSLLAAVRPEEPEEPVPSSAAEPWDRDSAEALAALYGPAQVRPQPPAVETAPAPVTMAAPPRGLDIEKDWLEQRFGEIAAKVEHSLAELRPDSSLLALGRRFEEFEQRFGSALGDVATRADVEGLRIVEAHINELATHFEQAHTQLSRLDVIEEHLSALIRRSEQPLVAPQPVAPARVSEQDIERVAAAVAGRLSAHIPAPAAQGSPDNLAGVDELKDLISGLVQERREGDEHTSAMLDTMQQAMMRLLDRMDSLEQSYASAPPARFAPEPRPAPQPAAPAPAPAADLRPMPAVAAFTPMPAEPRLEVARAAEPAPPRLAPEPSRPAPAQLAPAAAPRSAPAESLGPAGVIPAAAKAAGQSREDFIAAARRAARQAAERQAEAAVAAVEDAVPDPEVHGKSRAEVLGAPSAKSKSLLRSRMLVATLLVTLVGSGLAYTLLRKPAGLPAKIERRLLAPSTEAKERAEAAKKAQSEGQAAEQKAAATPPITPPVESEKRPSPAGAAPSAPAAAPTTAPAPAAKPAAPKRSVPETMVDELSDEQDPAVPAEPHKEAGIVGQVVEAPLPPGLTVQTMEGPLSPEQLVRVQQQKTVASFSNSIGARQGEMPAMPASLQPQATPSAPSATAAPSDAVARVAELPPAAVGPMSLRQAAAKGDPSAEFEVAARFAEGKGVEQDFRQAITWYQRAASRGFAPAQYRLATLYERGLGVKADTARARSWYARAAEQGNLKAMHNLAVLSAGRDQEAPDYATAAQWFTRAAAHGLADSQFNLAVLHESGIGVAKDLGAAYQWFALAARGGDREAARRRDLVKARLAPGELATAEARIAAFRPEPASVETNDPRIAGEAWKARQTQN